MRISRLKISWGWKCKCNFNQGDGTKRRLFCSFPVATFIHIPQKHSTIGLANTFQSFMTVAAMASGIPDCI